MAIEGQEQEQQKQSIPEFNPDSFLSDDNEVSVSNQITFTPEQQESNQEQEQEQEQNLENQNEQEISFEDDFLTGSTTDDVEPEFNPEDYAILSKTLGVEIDSKEKLEEIQNKIKGETAKTEQKPNYKTAHNFTPEEQKSYDTYENALNGAQKATNEELMSWHLKQLNPEKYQNNPEELEYHIDNLKDMDLLDKQADDVRSKIISEITANKESIISTAQNRTQTKEIEINRQLEAELKKHKEGFHGINMDAKSLKTVFDKVRNGSIFEEIESSQANVAEFALLWENRNLFYKAFENPDTSVGIKKMMDELQNSKAKPAAGKKTFKNPFVFDPEAFLNAEDFAVKGSQS